MDEKHLKVLATLKDRMLRIKVHLPADIEDALRAVVQELVERQQRITAETCKRLRMVYLGDDVFSRQGIVVCLRTSPPTVTVDGSIEMAGVTSAYHLRLLVDLRGPSAQPTSAAREAGRPTSVETGQPAQHPEGHAGTRTPW